MSSLPQQEPTTTGDIPVVSTGSLSPVTERLLSGGLLEIGSAEAPLTLLVFTNFSSDYCRRFQTEYVPRLMHDFIEPGKLRLQIAPLTLQKYPESDDASKLLHCAALQGSGRTMLDLLVTSPRITVPAILAQSQARGLDVNTLRACLEDTSTEQMIAMQRQFAAGSGVTLVPTFYLNGETSEGLPEYADLRGWIETTLETH